MVTASSPQFESEIDLDHYRRFVADHWRALLGGAVLGAIVALLIASLVPRGFQAAATLAVLPPLPGAPPSAELTQGGATSLLVNPELMRQAVDQLGSARVALTPERLAAAATVEALPAPRMLRLAVVLRDGETARAAANLLADKLVAASAKSSGEAALRLRDSLEKPLADAEARLKQAEARLADGLASTPDAAFSVPIDAAGALVMQRDLRASAGRSTASEHRTDLYAKRLEVARLQADYAERLRNYTALHAKYDEAAGAAADAPQLNVVGRPDSVTPLPRKRPQFAMLGALGGFVAGVLFALVADKRRVAPRP